MKPAHDRLVAEIARTPKTIEGHLPKSGCLERLLLPREVAELLRVEVETLEAWRSRGGGPVFVKVGRGRDVRYRPADVLSYLEQRVCRSTWDGAEVARN